jgi:hypothetical protein
MRKIIEFLYIMGLAAAFGILGFCLLSTASPAQDAEWLPRRWSKPHPRYAIYHYHHPRYIRREYPIYPRRYEEEARDPEGKCLGEIITTIGKETGSEDSALKEAEINWGALVRDSPGERWMDLTFARRYTYRCQRSSTGESKTAKIVEGITGGSGASVLYRCRIWAEPCTAPRKTSDRRD